MERRRAIKTNTQQKRGQRRRRAQKQSGFLGAIFSIGAVAIVVFVAHGYLNPFMSEHGDGSSFLSAEKTEKEEEKEEILPEKVLDKEDYDRRMLVLANNPEPREETIINEDGEEETVIIEPEPTGWPPKATYPNPGAILPFNRVVAYYGNFYSTQMGALGEYPADEMLQMLKQEARNWERVDPDTPVIPAIHYIASTAQAAPGKEGNYTLRMPDDQIDHALDLAERVDGIVFLDLQIGWSDLKKEVKLIEPYLKLPQVHLGIDPEFAMRPGAKPGVEIGTLSASDINWVSEYLAELVREYDLPPKIFVVHRFTVPMVSNYENIKPLPEVQIVIHMDGWGSPAKKKDTYYRVVYSEPVQFAGVKVFYKNDRKEPSPGIFTTEEMFNLRPRPIYIQYQ